MAVNERLYAGRLGRLYAALKCCGANQGGVCDCRACPYFDIDGRTVCRTKLHRELLELVQKEIARQGELIDK